MQRNITLAGTWFSSNSAELTAQLNAWTPHALLSQRSQTSLPVAAILVPHAGYMYSGPVAAKAYAHVNPHDYDTVLILAPSHRVSMPNMVSVEAAGRVLTPCGPVDFAEDLHKKLMLLPGATHIKEAHAHEHSLDIQLPMLQHFLLQKNPSLKVGGLVVGQWHWDNGQNGHKLACFARAFRELLTPRTLCIVSTDFTHYGKQFGYVPFESDIQKNLHALDHAVFSAFMQNDLPQFEDILNKTKATVCGRAPMSLMLASFPQNIEVQKLDYVTSGALTQNWASSVSYLSALVYADWRDEPKKETQAMLETAKTKSPQTAKTPEQTQSTLPPNEAELLLNLAKKALVYAVEQGRPMPKDAVEETLPQSFLEKRACFVTLHRQGQLRGCIGELLPTRPLVEAVLSRAHDAALSDRRFAPVTAAELPEITVDISVLSPPVAVPSPEYIQLGVHGIILQKQGRSAVFLPQVAPEQGWDLPTTLSHLAHKAGLHPLAWREGAEFFVFTAQLIG